MPTKIPSTNRILLGALFIGVGLTCISLLARTLSSVEQASTAAKKTDPSKKISQSQVLGTTDTNPGPIPGTTTTTPSSTLVSFPSVIDTSVINILRNSSFEQQNNSQPSSWNYQFDSSTGNTFISPEGIHSGHYGLKFTGNPTGNLGISQPTTATVPGHTYTFSAYIKYTNAPKFTVRIGFWDEQNNREGKLRSFSYSGTSDWKRISVTTTTPGLITDAKNHFPLFQIQGLTTGAVYIDDTQLEEGNITTAYNSAQAYTSSYGIGDGSLLFTPSGDIFPAVPGTGSIGSSTNQFSSLNLQNATIDSSGGFSFNGGGTIKGSLNIQSLVVNGTTLFSDTSSAMAVANGGTGTSSFAANGILYGNGTSALQVLAPSTAGYVLQTNGNGLAPSWVSLSGLSAGNTPFSGITSGTNTQAAMVVGTGGSLNYTGTGTINASSLQGNTWAAPGAIGTSTPNSGTFTQLAATGAVTFSNYGTGILHSDSSGHLTSSAINLANGDISGILGVANGGTGSNNGSITGTSGLVFAAGGTDQNITLTPSGTGFVILNGDTGIGTSNPVAPLHVAANAPDTAQGASLLVDGTLASSSNQQFGISSQPNVIPGTISTATYDGIYSQPYLDTSFLSGGIVEGLNSGVQYNGTAILGTARGAYLKISNSSTGTITTATGLYIDAPTNNGTITTNYGLYIASQSAGTTNYAIYANGGTSYFGGKVAVGFNNPASDLEVTAASTGTNAFRVYSTDRTKYVVIGYDGSNVKLSSDPNNNLTISAGGGHEIFLTNNLDLGGKTIYGGTSANTSLFLDSTSNGTKGNVILGSSGGGAGVGTSAVGNGALVVNTNGTGNLFSASTSGTTKFLIDNGGNVTGSGNLAVNGGSITTTQTSASIFNATPTTINLGGNATTLNLGATTGTTSVRNNLSVAGTTTINSVPYAWPSSQATGIQILQNDGSGNLSWVANSGSNYFQLNSGVLSPATQTDSLSIGTTGSLATLDVRALSGTLAIASVSGATSFAALAVYNSGVGALFTASKSGATKFVISNAGNIGINTAAPSNLLDITSTSVAGSGLYFYNPGRSKNLSINYDGSNIVFQATGQDFISLSNFYMNNKSLYKVGTLAVGGTSGAIPTSTTVDLRPNSSSGGTVSVASISGATSHASLVIDQSGVGDLFTASVSGATKFKITNGGSVVVGNGALSTSATDGFLYAPTSAGAPSGTPTTQSGTVAMEYDTTNNKLMIYNGGWKTTQAFADYAEWADAPGASSGDVVTITDEKNPTPDDTDPFVLRKSTKPYDQNLAGVISKYAEEGNNANGYKRSSDYHAVALIGRVPVKISSINGSIRVGDYLTASSIPGVAQKATKPGTMIGKALESYDSTNTQDIGQIMVLVNVSYADPTISLALTDKGDLSISGQTVNDTTTTSTPAYNATVTSQNAASGITTDQFNTLSTSVSGLQNQVASISSQLSNYDNLSKQLADLQKQTELTKTLQNMGTQSADLRATMAAAGDVNIGGKLSVTGRTLLGDVGITGVINNGLLTINGMDTTGTTSAATINTIGAPLKIQSLAVAGVDFENGKLIIDTNGDLITSGNITAKTVNTEKINVKDTGENASIGDAIIPAGQTTLAIRSTAITNKSHVFTSPDSVIPFPIGVQSKIPNKSFTIGIPKPLQHDLKFSWWIIN